MSRLVPRRRLVGSVGLAAALLLAACDEGGSPVVEPEAGVTTSTTTAPLPGEETQPALWPAPDVVLATPEEAAAGFIEQVVGVGLPGQFRAGDPRSGEIDVISAGEGGGAEIVRSTLLLRQLGAGNGWFVIAATNPNAAISVPASGAEVARTGTLHVEGVGRGFEGAVSVRLLRAGGEAEVLAEAATTGGALAEPAPFAVDLTVDLSALTGQTLILLVQGGVGLETDPGDFGAIPVVVEV